MNIKNSVDDWEWHWKLAIKLTKDQGLPKEEDYWSAITQKIMDEIETQSSAKAKKQVKDASVHLTHQE